jgi:predicted O-methyltransferase YrrM
MDGDADAGSTRLRHQITHRLPLSVRRMPFRAEDWADALVGVRRLRAARPDVVAALDAMPQATELRPQYDRYVTEISNWEWAVAWPTVKALIALCDQLKPHRILDLGSGFSTFVFADWARRRGEEIEIVSVDDSPDWLAKTRAYLDAQGLAAHVVGIEELTTLSASAFDLVFDDIGRSEDRAKVIEPIQRLAAPGAVVLLDDMNVRGYRREVRDKLTAAKWKLYSIRPYTIDAKGRFAMLTIAPGSAGTG